MGGVGWGGGKEEPEGLLVPSPIAVTATHRSKPNTLSLPFNCDNCNWYTNQAMARRRLAKLSKYKLH